MKLQRALAVGMLLGFGVAAWAQQAPSVVQDEHDKRVKADADRATKYHNNADDYPANKSSAPNVPTPAARIPVTPKPEPAVDPVKAANDARVAAAQPAMKREFEEDLAKANRGDTNGIYGAALAYQHGYGVSPNQAKALELYRSIADRSDLAAFEAGTMMFSGTQFSNDIPVNEAEGRRLIGIAAAHGYDKAVEWQKYHPVTAPSGAEFPAMQQYAEDAFLEFGKGAAPTTDAESERLLHLKRPKDGFSFKTVMKEGKAAEAAGIANLYGLGVPVNPNRAYSLFTLFNSEESQRGWVFWCWWKLNPKEPHDVAQYPNSGTSWTYEHALYESVHGNATEARKVLDQTLYNQHGQARPVQMLVDLGVMELEGRGGKQDIAGGLAHLKAAAAAGNKNGMYALGSIYERGFYGVAKDPAMAATLYQQAAAAGSANAAAKLKAVAAR